MSLYFTKEFLLDLKSSGDARLIRQVLSHTVDDNGEFLPNRDDHRFDGITDGWIRCISRGNSAYRVIFVRRGADVYLYRAGAHHVEDRLASPNSLTEAVPVRTTPEIPVRSEQAVDDSCLLKTSEATFVGRYIEAMYHVRHKQIFLVSPFLDLRLFEAHHSFRRFLDRAVEEGTAVNLITSTDQPPERLDTFKKLEESGISVFFLQGLHSKLYVFDIDLPSRTTWQKGLFPQAIVGSSNLTSAGLGLADATTNEELNCRLPSRLNDEIETYVTKLMVDADDYIRFRASVLRRNR